MCDVANVRYNAILVNNIPCDRGIKEIILIIDTNKIAEKIFKHIFKGNSKIVDFWTRK